MVKLRFFSILQVNYLLDFLGCLVTFLNLAVALAKYITINQCLGVDTLMLTSNDNIVGNG